MSDGAAQEGAKAALDAIMGHGPTKEPPKTLPLQRWQKDPIAWAQERLGIAPHTLRWSLCPGYADHVWDGEVDPIARIMEALAEGKDVAAESGTGTGKTFVAAVITLWFLDVFRPSRVVFTAPKEKQLTRGIWKEIGALWPRFQVHHPRAKKTKLHIAMDPNKPKWFATGEVGGVSASEESTVRMRGHHEAHMLFIIEEMTGMPAPTCTAIEQTCSDEHNLRLGIGNPDHQQDALHQLSIEDEVESIRVSCLDHPNVVSAPGTIPGATSTKQVRRRRKKYGEDGRLYKAHTRGLSPEEATDSLISWASCRASVLLDLEPGDKDDWIRSLGVDVANSVNGDRASIAEGFGPVLEKVETFQCPDSNAFGREKVLPLIRAYGIDPKRCGMDVVGVGVGAFNELVRLGVTVRGLGGADRAVRIKGMEERFPNLRCQMYWVLREDLRHGRVQLPDDEELFQDLCAPRWEPKGGKIHVQSKKEVKKALGGRSPDKGDAVVYWNFVRQVRSASTVGGDVVTL